MKARVAALAAGALWLSAALGNAVAGPVVLDPGSRLWIQGTSTIHDWESKATRLEFSIEPAVEDELESLVRGGGVTAGTLRVPVAEMKSHKDGLDKNMRKALSADRHPMIEFHLVKYTVTAHAGADSFLVKADGKLKIAGVEKPVEIETGARREGAGLRLRGREPVLMSDYGIKPPVMMLGTVKTGNEVMVYFDLLLLPDTTSAEAKP
jgi:polyisoprenoid-binding protein YceI